MIPTAKFMWLGEHIANQFPTTDHDFDYKVLILINKFIPKRHIIEVENSTANLCNSWFCQLKRSYLFNEIYATPTGILVPRIPYTNSTTHFLISKLMFDRERALYKKQISPPVFVAACM